MSSSDRIELRGVRAHGLHGVLPEEKRNGHEFVVDAVLVLDLGPAGRADVLGRTVNYAEAAQSIVDVISGPSRDLIETLAEEIAARILRTQALVRRIEVTVHKPSAPIDIPFEDVAVRICREAEPVEAVLALGTNMGDREEHLRRALGLLGAADGVAVIAAAPVVETEPVGGVLVDGQQQDPYLNTVVRVRSSLGPWELLELAREIEADAGRTRELRWGPRTLDVDVIAYGDVTQDDPELTLPHPRAHERAFVLAPWASVDPEAMLPGHGTVAELLAQAPDRDGLRPGPDVTGFGERAGRGGIGAGVGGSLAGLGDTGAGQR